MKTSIDMTRPSALYVGLAAILLLAAFILPRLGLTGFESLVHAPYRRSGAAAALGVSIVFGFLGALRHAARAEEPWRVPGSQPLLLVLLFTAFGALGLLLSL